jgi:PKD repeat protein
MSYYWNFNNGMGSTEKNPTNIFVQDGEYNVTLVVTDNDGTQNLTSKIIVVKNVAPEFENLDASVRAVRGELFEFDVDASDASSIDEISYSAEMPEGMEINSSTGAISWTPTASQLGIHSIIITVSDGDDSTSATLTIEVFADAIGLDEGWNLISLPLVPEDTSIESVLSEIQSSVRKVWSLQYNEESEKNEWIYKEVEEGEFLSGELEELTSGEGYYIQMNENSVLYTTGNKMYSQGKMAIPPSKKVDEGWNLIGKYGLNEELSNTEAFATLTGEVPSLIDKNGNTIEEMEISEGYWAFVTGGVQIYAPSSEAYSY